MKRESSSFLLPFRASLCFDPDKLLDQVLHSLTAFCLFCRSLLLDFQTGPGTFTTVVSRVDKALICVITINSIHTWSIKLYKTVSTQSTFLLLVNFEHRCNVTVTAFVPQGNSKQETTANRLPLPVVLERSFQSATENCALPSNHQMSVMQSSSHQVIGV